MASRAEAAADISMARHSSSPPAIREHRYLLFAKAREISKGLAFCTFRVLGVCRAHHLHAVMREAILFMSCILSYYSL